MSTQPYPVLQSKLDRASEGFGKNLAASQAIFGQISAFKSGRETVLRNMGWKQFGDKEIQVAINVITFHTDAILAAYREGK